MFSFTYRESGALVGYLLELQRKIYAVLMSLDDNGAETAICGRLMRLLAFASDSVSDSAQIVSPEILRFIERKMSTVVLAMRKSVQRVRGGRISPLLFEALTCFCRSFPTQTQNLQQEAVEYLLVVFDSHIRARYRLYFTMLSVQNLLMLQTNGNPAYAALLV